MDNNICEAAYLLRTMTEMAFKEMNENKDNIERASSIPSNSSQDLLTSSYRDEYQHSVTKSPEGPRIRTVSICSPTSAKSLLDFEPTPLLPPPMLLRSSNQQNIQPIYSTGRVCSQSSSFCGPSILLKSLDQNHSSLKPVALDPFRKVQSGTKLKSKYVGMHTTGKLRGVLRHKFNWKKFPELEELLKQRRDEYLQHSLNFNYTSAQKEYNNKLTREVLESACSLGYIFDRFTFVEVRDRIRCYYKSFVQCQRHKRTEPWLQSPGFEDRLSDVALTATENRKDCLTSQCIPSSLETSDLHPP